MDDPHSPTHPLMAVLRSEATPRVENDRRVLNERLRSRTLIRSRAWRGYPNWSCARSRIPTSWVFTAVATSPTRCKPDVLCNGHPWLALTRQATPRVVDGNRESR